MNGPWRPGRGLALFAALAFAAYLVVDLAVFPLATRFPDEERFVSEAIAFAQSGEFRVWESRAWEMPLTGLLYGALYAATGSEPALIAAARCLQALLLALCAMWLYRGEWRRLLPIYALFAYLTFVHTVTIASLRYRLPLEVFLVIFAAGALAHIAARRRGVVSVP